MKYLIVLLVAFFGFISCQDTKHPQGRDSDLQSFDTVPATHDAATTLYETTTLTDTAKLILPADIQLFSFQKNDSSRNTFLSIVIPQSKRQRLSRLDKEIKAIISKRKTDFLKRIDEMIQEDSTALKSTGSSFYAEPISVYKDYQLVSYCFIISYHHFGAAHPMTEYYSFNYDLLKNKPIRFSDYLQITSSKDTSEFVTIVNKAINRGEIGIHLPLKNLDFNIEKDTISFNFDDYEITSYAEGIIRSKVNRKEINKLINKDYR
jgi:hypothetical protein